MASAEQKPATATVIFSKLAIFGFVAYGDSIIGFILGR
jgi:hypothetical protein